NARGRAFIPDARECIAARLHDIGDTVDVQQQPVLGHVVDAAGQLADHRAASRKSLAPHCRKVPMWCSWQIATASASAASGDPACEAGSSTRTMTCTCSLPAWPAPTTDFLIRLAGYS